MLKRRLNTYLAILVLTIFGAGAAMIIVKVSNTQSFDGSNQSLDAAISQLNIKKGR
ncbi:MAG: hypothetical protein KGI41_03560 [Patescibacteria group bacterium]|nr:hypothetical protein [Patescibacteria group bacterium]